MKLCFVTLIICVLASPIPAVLAREVPSDTQYSLRALESLETYQDTQLGVGLMHGLTTTNTTGAKETDQRYLGSILSNSSLELLASAILRSTLHAKYEDLLKQDSASKSRKVKQKQFTLVGGADVAFLTSPQMEVTFGVTGFYAPKSKKDVELQKFTSSTSYSDVNLWTPRVGIIKRTDFFSAGLFFSLQKEINSSYIRKTAEQQDWGQELYVLPASLSAAAKFAIGQGFIVGSNLVYVFLGSSSEKTEEQAPIHRDYFSGKITTQLESGSSNLFAEISHRTMSYQDQSFMSIDNIPSTSLGAGISLGPRTFRFYTQVTAGYGQDTQSTPELNAEFKLITIQLFAGMKIII